MVKAGYSEKYASTNSNKLLRNTSVQAYISERLAALESERIASAAEVMKYLTSVLRGEETEETPLLVGEGVQRLVDKGTAVKDRLKAAELLGKRYGMFTDKLTLEGSIPVVITGEDALDE